MKTTIFCKKTQDNKQKFFVKVGNETYYLFQQEFRIGNEKFFRNGVGLHEINNYSNISNLDVRKTLDKLPAYLHYIEKEYDVVIYKKTKKKHETKKKKLRKVEPFRWQDYNWDIA